MTKLINNNHNRFRAGIDLLDLKQVISNNLFALYENKKAANSSQDPTQVATND